MADDLWPENIAESNMVTPVSILREQAALLGDKTKQLVTGEVQTTTDRQFVCPQLLCGGSDAELQV